MTRAVSESTLDWFRDSVIKDDSLLGQVRRHIIQTAGEDDVDRDTVHLHPSEVCKDDWCPRNSYYRMIDTPVSDKPANPSWLMETMWTRGKEIHARWQTTFWRMGVLEGWFWCLACSSPFPAKAPSECPQCGAPQWALRYNEVPIYDEHMMLIGHADAQVGDDLVEVKSMGPGTFRFDAPPLYELYQNGMTLEDVWKRIKRPFPVHVRQGMLYLHATGRQAMHFIYEAKWNQNAKQFVVRYSKNFIAPLVEQCVEVAEAVRGQRGIPRRPDWVTDENGKICRSCEYRSTCWKLEERTDGEADTPAPVAVRVKRSVGRPSRRKTTQPAA